MRSRRVAAITLSCGALLAFQSSGASADECRLTDAMLKDALGNEQPTRTADFFNSNCAFHQWSWMTFIWLTQKSEDGQLRFEALPRAEDVINPEGGADGEVLAPRQRKHSEPFDEVAQAGSHAILIDQDGRAVYYSQYVNDIFYDFVVKDHELYKPSRLQSFDPDANFPDNALELKASWKILSDSDDAGAFYTRDAMLSRLEPAPDGSSIQISDETYETTVALVGLHVVGRVPGHPEMIWATFEHIDNAPDFAADQQPEQPVSERDYTFYTAGTVAGACNQDNADTLKLTSVEEQTLEPVSQVCRQFAWGGGSSDNVENIQSLNQSALDRLAGQAGGSPPPIWKNYLEIGAIWFLEKDQLRPNLPLDTIDGGGGQPKITGSTHLNNATIETFTQDVASANNCFACHNTTMRYAEHENIAPLKGHNVNISHILLEAYLQNQDKFSAE